MKIEKNIDYSQCSLCGRRVYSTEKANYDLEICHSCLQKHQKCAQFTYREKKILDFVIFLVVVPIALIIVTYVDKAICYLITGQFKWQNDLWEVEVYKYIMFVVFFVLLGFFISITETLAIQFKKYKNRN